MPPGDHLPRYRIADLVIDGHPSKRAPWRIGNSPGKLSFDVFRALIEAAPNVVSNGNGAAARSGKEWWLARRR